MARRYDPERRERIIAATIDVACEHGIDGVSHRRVAAAADVPLGSTTYHFASREDLVYAALRQSANDWLELVEHWERSVDTDVPFEDELVRLVEVLLDPDGDRARTRMEYELYLAALHHPYLRPIAAECLDAFTAVLRRHTGDEAGARALAALLDGLTLQLLLTDRPVDRAELRSLLVGAARKAAPTP